MPIGVMAPGTDQFDLAVNFGSYRYYMFFRAGPHCTPLPRTPPPAGMSCHCPSCTSEGWYAHSPVCRFWRAHCEFCRGTRFGLVYEAGRRPRREPCDLCAEEWREDVNWFREALRNPRRVADQMRREAAAAASRADAPTAVEGRTSGLHEHIDTDSGSRPAEAADVNGRDRL